MRREGRGREFSRGGYEREGERETGVGGVQVSVPAMFRDDR